MLRDFKEGDWKTVHRYASDPEVARYVDWGPNTIEETRNSFGEQLRLKENTSVEITISQ
jgi:hypothetical protein